MAANDYYRTGSYSTGPQYDNHSHTSSHPTAMPAHDAQSIDISPVTSPFDDHAYPSNNSSQYKMAGRDQTPAASTEGLTSGHYNNDYSYTSYQSPGTGLAAGRYDGSGVPKPGRDPFDDRHAIPLQDRPGNASKNNFHTSGGLSENLDHRPYDEAGAYEENRQRRSSRTKRSKEKYDKRTAWAVWVLTTVQIAVFIGELIRNGRIPIYPFMNSMLSWEDLWIERSGKVLTEVCSGVLTGTPIAIKPQFNFMIGPSPYVLINMGARYPPCMHNIRNITDRRDPATNAPETVMWMCPNSTSNTDFECTLSQACGMGGVPEQVAGTDFKDRSHEPNQWWRFIVPIFLHAGLIHIGFNLLLQVTLGRDIEKLIGTVRFVLVYFASGIFGFVLGGNYAAPLIAST
jgi:hypothetical protein